VDRPVSVEIIDGESFCRLTSDPEVSGKFSERAGHTWPNADTPVTTDFQRTFEVRVVVAPPHQDSLSVRDPEHVRCRLARTVRMNIEATFRIRAEDVVHDGGLTCQQGEVVRR